MGYLSHPQARIASDRWRNTNDHGREKGGEAMSRLFSPSLLPLRKWEKDFLVQERVILFTTELL